MQIQTVTVIGINDAIRQEQLLKVSEYYPFVEWGVNLYRTPGETDASRDYLDKLFEIKDRIRICGNLKGEWSDDFKKGNLSFKKSRKAIWEMFNRLQVETIGGDSELVLRAISLLKTQVIMETDFIREIHLDAISRNLNVEVLFKKLYFGIWQQPIDEISCSYLCPFENNIENDLAKMSESLGSRKISIQINYSEKLEEELSLIEEYVSEPSRSSGFFETKYASNNFR